MTNKAFVYYRRLKRLREFVERNSEKKLGIAEAAKIVCLEKKYFSAYFRKHIGMKYSDWINRLKIEKAKFLMYSGDYQISELCDILGYEVSTFERRFKKLTGLSPSGYKKVVKSEVMGE
jgi:AraC family transcriptional regulator, arabinose operon regulatory protein